MAISPAHQFGQEVGLLLEEIIQPLLASFTQAHGFYLDAKGPRGAARRQFIEDNALNVRNLDV